MFNNTFIKISVTFYLYIFSVAAKNICLLWWQFCSKWFGHDLIRSSFVCFIWTYLFEKFNSTAMSQTKDVLILYKCGWKYFKHLSISCKYCFYLSGLFVMICLICISALLLHAHIFCTFWCQYSYTWVEI